jgi:hypothetical protein
MSQAAPGFLLHLRLFLEGIEVPVISASVNSTIGSGATATVDIIPDDSVDLILPRTTVHIFYLDSFEFSRSGRNSPLESHYKLLFAGEVFSISSQKAGMGSRSVSLNCMDFSNCLDTNYVYQFQAERGDSDASSILRNTSRFLATLDSRFDNIINSPSSVIRQLTNQSAVTEGLAEGQQSLLSGLFAIIERLLGIQGNYYGTNPWITVQERRARFIESIVSDSGETARALYAATEFTGWLTHRISQEGQVIPFRRLIDIICEFIFYRMVPNPSAKYVRGNSGKFPGYPNRDLPVVPKIPSIGDTSGDASGGAAGFSRFAGKNSGATITGLQSGFASDVLGLLTAVDTELRAGSLASRLPARIKINRGFVEKNDNKKSLHLLGLAIDVRFIYEKGSLDPGLGALYLPNEFAKKSGAAPIPFKPASWYQRLYNAVVTKNIPKGTPLDQIEIFIKSDSTLYAVWNNNEQKLKEDITVARDWISFAGIMRRNAPSYGLQVMAKMKSSIYDPLLEGILGVGDDPVHIQYPSRGSQPLPPSTPIEAVSEAPEGDTVTSGARERLHSFIFRPDVWFVAPPKSNVIFPDALQSFSTQREMMRETSRLQLDVSNSFAPDSAVTPTTYFAPQISGQDSLQVSGFSDASKLLIYDHERFSGVVPKFERMMDVLFHMQQDQTQTAAAGEIEKFASVVAHFHLLSQRFQARSASVGMAFSPHIICGFPAVVMDAIITADEVKSKELSLNRSYKLGLVESVVHSLSQGGGQTQVRLTHVRSHRTGDKSDDLFTPRLNSDGEVTLATQDAANVGLSAGVQTFGCVASKKWGESGVDSEYGFKAIAAVFGFSSIEELIRSATSTTVAENSPVDWVAYDTGPVRSDASEALPQVQFSPTDLRGRQITGGSWSGNPQVVYLSILREAGNSSEPETEFSDESSQINVSTAGPAAPISFQPATSTEIEPRLTRFFVVGNNSVSFIPVTLPGAVFTPDITSSVNTSLPLPVEESIRPRWISADYSSTNITAKIYDPFFGTKSITDGVLGESYSLPSVEESVDKLAKIYAREVVQTEDVTGLLPSPLLWIHEYTYRDIATLPEILGSKTYDPVTKKRVDIDPSNPKCKYLGGFHSNAVNFGSDKYGKELAFLDIKGVGLTHNEASSGNTAPFTLEGAEGDRMDPRAERANRVLQYKRAIRGDEALISGVGSSAGIGKRG